MLRKVNNFVQVLVVKDEYEASGTSETVANMLSSGTNNDVAIEIIKPSSTDISGTYDNGQILDFSATDALGSNDEFRVVVKRGNYVETSDIIEYDTITEISKGSYSAATQQVDYVGYNGSSGAIEAINSNAYYFGLEFLGDTYHDQARRDKETVIYGSPSSNTTGYHVAHGVIDNFNKGMALYRRQTGEDVVKLEAICDESGGALSVTTGDLTVTKGSKYVTAATDADGELAVNDFFRATSTDTDGVYRVVAIDTSNEIWTLDRPYEGSSATLTSTNTTYIASATGLAADWGIKITGVDLNREPGYFKQGPIRFRTYVDDFGDTTITNDTAADRGTGTTSQVQALEKQFMGISGHDWRTFPQQVPRSTYADAIEASTGYDLYTIHYKHEMDSTLGSQADSTKTLIIAVDEGSTVTGLDAAFGQ